MSGFKYFSTVLLFLLIQSVGNSQGVIFTRQEADLRFGPVLMQKEISVNTIRDLILTTEKLMIRMNNGEVTILDSQRRVLYPEGAVISGTDVFTVYSTSAIQELLGKGAAETIIIEKRASVLSVSNGEYTMEFGTLCPPICD